MIIEYIAGQLFLVLYNLANSRIDAYRILKNKKIAHGINFICYMIFCSLLCFLMRLPIMYSVLLFFSAFFNRQFSFDIPLNLRRGLEWYYQSTANPPKAILDRMERALFGTGDDVGKKVFNFYLFCYCVVTNIWVLASFIM